MKLYRAAMVMILLAGAIAVSLAFANCTPDYLHAGVPRNVRLMVLQPQDAAADSLGFVVVWNTPSLGSRHLPLASYRVHLLWSRDGADTLLVSSEVGVPTTYDSLWVKPLPPLLEERRYYAAVASIDTMGTVGAVGVSNVIDATVMPLPPPPPDSIGIDTIPIPIFTLSKIEPDSAGLRWGFGTTEFEFLAYADTMLVACARAIIFQLTDVTLDLGVETMTNGVCVNRDMSGVPSTFRADNGVLVSQVYWASAATWIVELQNTYTPCVVPGECKHYHLTADVRWPTGELPPPPNIQVRVEDADG